MTNTNTNTKSPAKTLKILITDDRPEMRLLLQSVLIFLGYQSDTATNGQEAVTAALNSTYDVIFMDCNMPIMDGITATQTIRAYLPPQQQPNIIAYTTDENRDKCLAAGMDDFVAKSIDLAQLRQKLNTLAAASVSPISRLPTPLDSTEHPIALSA